MKSNGMFTFVVGIVSGAAIGLAFWPPRIGSSSAKEPAVPNVVAAGTSSVASAPPNVSRSAPVASTATTPARLPASTLPAPAFSKGVPQTLTPDERGDLQVNFEKLTGAVRYRVVIRNEAGRRLRTRSSPLTKIIVPKRDLPPPGKYWVTSVTLDSNGEEGSESERRALIVTPEMSHSARSN